MTQNKSITGNNEKQRLTAFVDTILVKRAKIQAALEGLTISQVVEKALEVYSPKLEKDSNENIHLKFHTDSGRGIQNSEITKLVPKHSKSLTVPRQ